MGGVTREARVRATSDARFAVSPGVSEEGIGKGGRPISTTAGRATVIVVTKLHWID